MRMRSESYHYIIMADPYAPVNPNLLKTNTCIMKERKFILLSGSYRADNTLHFSIEKLKVYQSLPTV